MVKIRASAIKMSLLFIVLGLSLVQVVGFKTSDGETSCITHYGSSDTIQGSHLDSASKQLFQGAPPPRDVYGKQRTLAILVEFADIKHSYSESDLNDLIFVRMRDYWQEVSYGKIWVAGKTVGWSTLSHNMAYYGADSKSAIDDPSGDGESDSWRLIRDAVSLVDVDVDFKEYDHLMIVHAGIGQESDSTSSDNIWSVFYHDLSITTNDGINVTVGLIVPEAESPGGIKSALGVFAHEYGHSLGLADLYTYRHRDVETLEDWSLMDHGEWLGNPPGSCPAQLEAWGRIRLGWISPIVVQPLGQKLQIFLLESKTDLTKAIKVPLTKEVYYIVEARQRVGFDSCLPGEGVLIMRVDEGRRSGEGIIRLLDAVPSTLRLNDAAFQVGENFEDDSNHVYVRIHSKDQSSYQVVVSRKPIVLTRLVAANEVSASYHDEITFSVLLTDSKGKPLPNLIVYFECSTNGTSSRDLGRSVTNAFGQAFLGKALDIKPGGYSLGCVFRGGELGDFYYLPQSAYSTLTVAKRRVFLWCDEPTEATILGEVALTVRSVGSDNKPTPRVPIHVYADGLSWERTYSDDAGLAVIIFRFGFLAIGKHKIRIEVPENEFYEKAELIAFASVHTPVWLWILILAPLILSFLVVLKKNRLRQLITPWSFSYE